MRFTEFQVPPAIALAEPEQMILQGLTQPASAQDIRKFSKRIKMSNTSERLKSQNKHARLMMSFCNLADI